MLLSHSPGSVIHIYYMYMLSMIYNQYSTATEERSPSVCSDRVTLPYSVYSEIE